MRILHVVPAIENAGGVFQDVAGLAEHAIKAGDTVQVATSRNQSDVQPRIVPGAEMLVYSSKSELSSMLNTAVAACDIVHLHGVWSGENRMSAGAARGAGKPYVISTHGQI